MIAVSPSPTTVPPRRSVTVMLVAALVLVALASVGIALVGGGQSSDHELSSSSLPLSVTGGWQRYEVRTDDGAISWSMPIAYRVDGPRSLAAISPPAIGTFWVQSSPTLPLRHEVDLFEHLQDRGSDNEAIGRRTLGDIAGAPITVRVHHPAHPHGTEFEWTDEALGRIHLGYAYSWGGNVLTLDVAYLPMPGHPAAQQRRRDLAYAELEHMIGTVSFGK